MQRGSDGLFLEDVCITFSCGIFQSAAKPGPHTDWHAPLEWFMELQALKLSKLSMVRLCVQFSDDSRWWVEERSGQISEVIGRVKNRQGATVQFVQRSPPKLLTVNRWCPPPERTNGIKYPDSVRHTHKLTLILQDKRLMGIWRMFLRSFSYKERKVLSEEPFL